MDAVGELLHQLCDAPPPDRARLRKLKASLATQSKRPLIRNDVLLTRYRQEVAGGRRRAVPAVEWLLRLNSVRSESGIATVTVITEPYACPGRCVYCPTETRAPKSYLPNEPAVLRALRNDYDPYRQVRSRLEALDQTGHPTDKLELIVKGGTWSFYPRPYQRWFIQRCVDAANEFAQGSTNCGLRIVDRELSNPKSKIKNPKFPDASDLDSSALEEAQRTNETARHRIIGVTIETRPDYISDEEIQRLRALGVTRVELGVQSLEEAVLSRVIRDHGTAEVRQATQLLKDAAFKVAYHIMPNLPGASPQSDRETARRLFEDSGYQPDALKLYPCVVLETAELSQWWREGRYQPYDDETLLELLVQIKSVVPPYVRIERVIRDIPSTSIQAGCLRTNLREEVQRRMAARGVRCRCIRCRQVRGPHPGPFTFMRRSYAASEGMELFLSVEHLPSDRLASLLRLRIPSLRVRQALRGIPALADAALIRELHTYGQHLPLHERVEEAVQHRGLGTQLLRAAERIAREEFGLRRMAVIAGVGVREYYRRLGYALHETYMVKTLDGP